MKTPLGASRGPGRFRLAPTLAYVVSASRTGVWFFSIPGTKHS